jgi:large subunit ribosomal protein L23
MKPFEVIKTVRITEKGTRQGEKYNQYTVKADVRANKTQIRQAVQELFKVKVLRVNTLRVRGKIRRQRRADEGFTNQWKKAIVTLKEGDRINLM